MSYVLITIFYISGGSTPVTTSAIEFKTKESCLLARERTLITPIKVEYLNIDSFCAHQGK